MNVFFYTVTISKKMGRRGALLEKTQKSGISMRPATVWTRPRGQSRGCFALPKLRARNASAHPRLKTPTRRGFATFIAQMLCLTSTRRCNATLRRDKALACDKIDVRHCRGNSCARACAHTSARTCSWAQTLGGGTRAGDATRGRVGWWAGWLVGRRADGQARCETCLRRCARKRALIAMRGRTPTG